MAEVRAVLYDCDGVLVNSREANLATYQNLLGVAGYEKPSREVVEELFHLPLKESIAELIGTTDAKEIDRIIKLVENKSVRRPDLFEFPVSLEVVLADLHRKHKQGIVTSRIKLGLDDVLDSREISQFFNVLVAREDYRESKPAPDSLLVAARLLLIPPEKIVYVGDSHVDVEAAKAAGMMSIHLAAKAHNDADIAITDFGEVPAAVKKLAEN